jgi:oligopeptidase B
MKREKGIIYSVSSWDNKFYNHTNKDAEDFKIDVSDSLEKQNWETFIPPRDEVLIGGCTFLKNWIIRSETSNALDKLFVKNISSGVEEELIFSNENVYVPGISLTQRIEIQIMFILDTLPQKLHQEYIHTTYQLKLRNL